jgi:hypothetical protein
MFDGLTDEDWESEVFEVDRAVFWLQQCYNPHARQWTHQGDHTTRRSPYSLYIEVLGRSWWELVWDEDAALRLRRYGCRYLPLHYDAAFGTRAAETLFGTTISRPEEVTVLCYAGRTTPDHVHFAPYYCKQVWVFRKIRALALERYLLAVRALLRPHGRFLPGEQSKTPILGNPDVADMIVACLAAWHAGQPHEDALPRGPHWRGFASAPGF